MKMVIVTLSFVAEGKERSYDMEMPCQVSVRTLTKHICQTLEQYLEGRLDLEPSGLRLWCRRLNRVLLADETLEDAGIWNGDHMELKY